MEEFVSGISHDRDLLLADYTSTDPVELAARIEALDAGGLAQPAEVARALRIPQGSQGLDTPVSARGHRMLDRVPRLPHSVANAIVTHMGSLQRIMGSTVDELQEVEGIGPLRARAVRESLSRIAETSLERRF